MDDLSQISARWLALSLSSHRKSLLAGSLPTDKVTEARAKVAAIRKELERRGIPVSKLP